MPQTITVKREGLMLDLLLFQVHGAAGQQMIEAALELNPGLADLGPVFPLGTIVIIPDRPADQPFRPRPVVTLFG